MAKSWLGKTYSFFFGRDDDEEGFAEELEEPDPYSSSQPLVPRQEPQPTPDFRPNPSSSRPRRDLEPVLELHGPPAKPTVEIHYPQAYDDAKKYGDLFKEGKMVTVDLESGDKRLRQQIVDFLSGVAYGLGGTVQKVNPFVFIFAPHNFLVVANNPPLEEGEEED